MNYFNLPVDIINIIKNYLWGHKEDWMRKFNIIIRDTNDTFKPSIDNIIYKLNICNWQKRLNIDTNIEDNFYCPVCGEKNLFFAFTGNPKSFQECMCII